jgi:hypothetical protein
MFAVLISTDIPVGFIFAVCPYAMSLYRVEMFAVLILTDIPVGFIFAVCPYAMFTVLI